MKTCLRRDVWIKLLVALFVVLLCFSQQMSALLVEKNACLFHWELSDGLAILLDAVVLSVLAVAVSAALEALGWARLRRLYNHLFVLVLFGGLLSLLPTQLYPRKVQLAWLAAAAIAGASYACPRSPLVKWAKNLCLIFSPLVLILPWQLLTMHHWGSPPEPRAVLRSTAPASGPVLFCVFDAWSYARSIDRTGQFLPFFENLRALTSQSFNFRRASSTFHYTNHSLPAIIFQTERAYEIEDGQAFFEHDGRRTPCARTPSLFTAARQHGYATALVGWYLPYRKILGDQLGYCASATHVPKGRGLGEKMLFSAVANLGCQTDLVSEGLHFRLGSRLNSRYFADMTLQTVEKTRWLIEHSPEATFIFTHWPIPHSPFVLDADGSYRGPYDPAKGLLYGRPSDNERHLRYLDVVIGDLVDRLQTSGRYDDATIVLTGDHSWVGDPEELDRQAMRHVPLVIKLPGQRSAYTIDSPIGLHQLGPIMQQAFAGELSEQRMLQLLPSR